MTHGIKVTVDEKDRFMTSSPKDTTSKIYPPLLDAGVPPPLWPDSLRTLATDLEKTILVKWKDQMDDENRLFVILYTPKGIKTPANETNSWKPWLMNFCLQNNIPFIDPTEKLVITQQKGFDVFYDHYTKYGHKAVSDEFINWFLTNYKK
jgi:hypothetical protein